MKIQQVDDTPIKNIEEDWGNPDGTGKKAKTLGQVQKFIKAKINEIENKTVRIEKSNKEFESKIINQIENYKPVEIHGDVTNAADEEDLTAKNGLIKIADRGTLHGKGYKILRRGADLASQLNKENTIYEIRYDFDLGGEMLNIPARCTLKFAGGSLKNGTLVVRNKSRDYDNIYIEAEPYQIFYNVYINGIFSSSKMPVEWFGATGDGKSDDTESIRYAIKFCLISNDDMNGEEGVGSYRDSTIFFRKNSIYKVTGPVNYWDNIYHNVLHINLQGEAAGDTEVRYPYMKTQTSCILLEGKDWNLFSDATISKVTFSNLGILGVWGNWDINNIHIFNNCHCSRLVIKYCTISYIHSLFYNSGVWGSSYIHDNRFFGCYNFGYIEDDFISNTTKDAFVDSAIFCNYINGMAPTSGVNRPIDNYFFKWRVANGLDIHHNFIDYYRVMYGNNSQINNINSNNNHYQVFRYFHLCCNIFSNNDYFSGNDDNEPAIANIMPRYVKDTYTISGVTYDVPNYIARDYDYRSVIFKDAVIEKMVNHIVFLTGCYQPHDFIIEIHSNNITSKGYNFSPECVVKMEIGEYGFYNALKNGMFNIQIDRKLYTTMDIVPDKNDCRIGSSGWRYVPYERIRVGDRYYSFKPMVFNNDNLTQEFIFVEDTNNQYIMHPSYEYPTEFPYHTLTIYSENTVINATDTSTSYGNKVNSITLAFNTLYDRIIRVRCGKNSVEFTNFKNKFGKNIKLNVGDVLEFIRDSKTKTDILIGYGIKNEQDMATSGGSRPSSPPVSFQFFDTTLNKPIWWNGTFWVDSSGEVV